MDFKDDYVITEVTTCGNCGEKDNFRDVTTDMIDHIETEKDRFCNNCDELMDCWAYGYWQKPSEDAAEKQEIIEAIQEQVNKNYSDELPF